MKFNTFSTNTLIGKISDLGVGCEKIFGLAFCMITPAIPDSFELKNKFKPRSAVRGLYTEYHADILNNRQLVDRAQMNLRNARYFGDFYSHPDGALKFHISLNNIGNIDEEIILGLVQLLRKEAESADNNMSYHFKIIEPFLHSHIRFSQNDQITMYFDKYSSLGDMIDLAQKINIYLEERIGKNEKPLGEKDSCDINSFVSARVDTNRLLSTYDVFPFFDLEIKKFIGSHTADELREVPICAIEAVFNKVISSSEITIPPNTSKESLSPKDSKIVHEELELMLAHPAKYLGTTNLGTTNLGTTNLGTTNLGTTNLDTTNLDTTLENSGYESKPERHSDNQAGTFGFNMHTLSLAMKVMGGLVVALGLVALIIAASFGGLLMLGGAVAVGVGIASFVGGFFVSPSEQKDTPESSNLLSAMQ